MAVLLVRIEDLQSLPLNEFFDYNGHCYALTRSRELQEDVCIDLEDFYEASFQTTELTGIPVIFVCEEDPQSPVKILGWYKSATVYRKVHRKSLFLEGNVEAVSSDAVRLSEPGALIPDLKWVLGSQLYEVIEEEDSRCHALLSCLSDFEKGKYGANAFLRYPYVHVTLDPRAVHDFDSCISCCDELAAMIMQNECEDIRGIKALEFYAKQAASLNRKDAGGHYYYAMASDQLGFIRQGMKAITKALQLEPDASDLHGEKGSLLTAMQCYPEAAQEYRKAYELSGEEDYLLLEGKVWLMSRQMQKGYDCFKEIRDEKILTDAGIRLKDIETRWPFISIRGFHFKNQNLRRS